MKNKLTFATIICVLSACQTIPPQTDTPVKSETAAAPQTTNKTPAVSEQPATTVQNELYLKAIQSAKNGELDTAIQQFKQVLATDPTTQHVYTNLGLLYFHQGNLQQAKQAFLQAIEQDKNDAVAYNHLAVIQRQQGEFKQALFNYYKAIKAQPEYANAHLNLGILLDLYIQDLPKALEQYEIYQQLTGNSNDQVTKWIADTKRRISSSGK